MLLDVDAMHVATSDFGQMESLFSTIINYECVMYRTIQESGEGTVVRRCSHPPTSHKSIEGFVHTLRRAAYSGSSSSGSGRHLEICLLLMDRRAYESRQCRG